MTTYRLAIDGEDLERYYWGLFIKDQFPSYENFWLKFVVPLTNRPTDIHFKNNTELIKIGKQESDICIAQLSYSVLRHLIRCFEIRKIIDTSLLTSQFDLILEGMTRLVGCLDISFELIDRLANPTEYNAFDIKSGLRAQQRKQKGQKNDPFELIRHYRNHLVHGRMSPQIIDRDKWLCLPAIGKESQYLDWRKVTNSNNSDFEKSKDDFLHVSYILRDAWDKIISYLENNWKNL